MKDFQRILEDCLTKLADGTATLDECLVRYPNYAEELAPLLTTALLLSRGRSVTPSPTFHAYTRSAVVQYIRSHPRQPRNVMPLFQRGALTFAMLAAALLVTGTANAQSALPGDTFYSWKRASEQIWRAITLDPVATDLLFAERRLGELLAVADDPTRSGSAMDNYMDALSQLESTGGDAQTLTLVAPALQVQQQTLDDAGLSNSELDDYLDHVVDSITTTTTTTTVAAATATQVLPTATHIPPSATDVPPTAVPPTDIPPTDVPPTATDVPPTATDVPPTATDVPPTATDVPPTATRIPPTATDIPPTNIPPTDIPPTDISPAGESLP